MPGLGLLAVTSPDLLHRGWSARRSGRWAGKGTEPRHIEKLHAPLSRDAGIVPLLDGSHAALSWLGGVPGRQASPLALDPISTTGKLQPPHRHYHQDPTPLDT